MKHSVALTLIRSLTEKADDLSRLLGVADCSTSDQTKVLEEFSDMLLNRILLSVPPEYEDEIKAAVKDEWTDLNGFAETLRRCVPDFDAVIAENVDITVKEFRKAKPDSDRPSESSNEFLGRMR